MENSSNFLGDKMAEGRMPYANNQHANTDTFNARFNMLLQELTEDLSSDSENAPSFQDAGLGTHIGQEIANSMEDLQ